MNEESNEAKKLTDAANSISKNLRTLSATLILVSTYITLTAASTTHEDLLLGGQSLSLPMVSAQLPLKEFYCIAPLFIVLLHLTLLVQYIFLAERIRDLYTILPAESRVDQLRYLYPAPFVHLFLGSDQRRLIILIMNLIFIVTTVVFPLVALLTLQVQFLPYHSTGITGWHQFLVSADIAMLAWFWISVRAVTPLPRALRDYWVSKKKKERVALTLSIAAVVLFGWVIITIFVWGYTLQLHRSNSIKLYNLSASSDNRLLLPAVAALLAAIIAPFLGRILFSTVKLRRLGVRNILQKTWSGSPLSKSWAAASRMALAASVTIIFSMFIAAVPGHSFLTRVFPFASQITEFPSDVLLCRSLKVNKINLLNHPQMDVLNPKQPRKISLVGRDLRYADLSGYDLSGGEIINCNLENALLVGTKLENIETTGSDLTAVDFSGAILSNARFDQVVLSGGEFSLAQMPGAHFNDCTAHNAQFENTNLQDCEISESDFRGAIFKYTKMRCASIYFSRFSGAYFDHADIEGSSLVYVALNGAVMLKTQMDAAIFNTAHFNGSMLSRSKVSNAAFVNCSFDYAELLDLDFTPLSREQLNELRDRANAIHGKDDTGYGLWTDLCRSNDIFAYTFLMSGKASRIPATGRLGKGGVRPPYDNDLNANPFSAVTKPVVCLYDGELCNIWGECSLKEGTYVEAVIPYLLDVARVSEAVLAGIEEGFWQSAGVTDVSVAGVRMLHSNWSRHLAFCLLSSDALKKTQYSGKNRYRFNAIRTLAEQCEGVYREDATRCCTSSTAYPCDLFDQEKEVPPPPKGRPSTGKSPKLLSPKLRRLDSSHIRPITPRQE